ncbi:hypothetical protein [Burkholderia diffusa]|uniref:hypothetical protein n=1 Tax=Burkholderia diffusa TaxID=488732 RepID=UPI000B328E6F
MGEFQDAGDGRQYAGLAARSRSGETQLPAGDLAAQSVPLSNDLNDLHEIVKVDARRPTQVPTFDSAKATIQQQLQELAVGKASAEFADGLLKGATTRQ